ncbi:probable LRR receptor-like serine/threonine-protein kinase At3g47570 [Quercus robur]|uniref:probable LRR receptor-like serine/threonine-protein kinase At3g47570 n=1 Tax=Quercus robur TaxID=38942 RepID=UPI00216230A7|nr:probable LRR receptor-like serine/threonine-protein kinase At3g47570 [Quercus robur]
MSSCLKSKTVPALANETDRLALLDFKNRITQDPLQIMSSWNDSVHFCNWIGVTCSPSSKRVTVLDLEAKRLVGPIPPSIGNLTCLTGINLRSNSFNGEIPQEVGRLQRLHHLNLSRNSFGGKLPTNLSYCTQLRVLDVAYNNLVGQIPDHLSSLSKLVNLSLGMNNLTGSIPAWIGNFSSLNVLSLLRNNFHGSIPSELGHLSRLRFLRLSANNLSNTIPPQIYNISFIYYFSVTDNQLHGSFPTDVGFTLPNLQIFYCGVNSFTGPIPKSLSNASQLRGLDLGENSLTGIVPQNLANLQSLLWLSLGNNSLGKGKDGDLSFLNFLANCTSLGLLNLESNNFGGVLPCSIANLSTQLDILVMGTNKIHGNIPTGIGNLVNLSCLGLENNYLGGALPFEVGNLVHLTKLDLSKNKISSKIPTALGTCISLQYLYLGGNSFEGVIPQSLKNLRGLEDIDLSHNKLFGHIPEFLSKLLALKHLNISYNDFEGEVPSEGIFANASAISIFGNERLCGGVQELNLSSCSSKHPKLYRRLLALRIIIPITCITICVLLLLYFFPMCSTVKKLREGALTTSSFGDWQFPISYAELLESTNGFSENNLIGSGSFGSVYKGVLSRNGAIVAIKVLHLQQQEASTSFTNECNALRNIRHHNLLKIFSTCSSIDHKGNDFKSLIFEFMCNGSLDLWLHPKNDERHQRNKLSFIQRLNIAIDVAYALEYLHQHCQTPIVHCDIKPGNILLDEDMVAHVGDFGLVRFLFEASNNPSKTQTLSVGLKGSIGYIPPEYGMGGQISTSGDIFSYGILLLEMFTGKKPIDEMFIDGLSIHKFTSMALPEHVMDIVDPSMFFEEDGEDVGDERNEDDIEDRAIIEEVPHLNHGRIGWN